MYKHIPVMIDEVIKYLKPLDGDLILDGTFGAGGYTRRILDSSKCSVIGVDRDSNVGEFVNEIKFKYKDRFSFINTKFSLVKDFVLENSLDGLVLDLGFSSMQIDDAERGFSFNKDAPLKMTMGINDISAYDVVNSYEEKNIADIIYNYGDEVRSRFIAKKICDYRKNKSIETTVELADIVRSCFPNKKTRIDYSTKTFQALRIFVNDELNELKTILNDSIKLLKKNGRIVIVSFHSLEDKIVKKFFIDNGNLKNGKINKYSKNNNEESNFFNVMTKKPVVASFEEINNNIRSRSAKLRGAIKC